MLADRVRIGNGVNGIFPPYIYKDGKFGLDITQTVFPVEYTFGHTDIYFYMSARSGPSICATNELVDFTNYNTVKVHNDIGNGTEWLGEETLTLDVSSVVGGYYLCLAIEPFSQGQIRFTVYLSPTRNTTFNPANGLPFSIRSVVSKYYPIQHLRVYQIEVV